MRTVFVRLDFTAADVTALNLGHFVEPHDYHPIARYKDNCNKIFIRMLITNPQKPFLAIAKKIGISSQTVKKRYDKMKMNNVVFGSSIIIDLSKIGFLGKVFLLAKGSKKYESKNAIKLITRIPNVFIVSEIVGPHDLLIMFAFRSAIEIQEIVNKIRVIPSIENVEIIILFCYH